jgi:DNA-binding phage protein
MVKVINIDTKTRTIRVENADGDIKTWRTTESGTHFPIKKGESTKEALDKFVEKKRPEAKKESGSKQDIYGDIKDIDFTKLTDSDIKKIEQLYQKSRATYGDDNQLTNRWRGKLVEAQKAKQQSKKETPDTKGTMKESATDWYVKKFKGDKKMAPKDGVTFEQLYESLKKGENIYEKMGVDDSIVRERVMSEMADRLGVKYDHVYDLWLNGGEKDSEPRKKKQEEAIALMDKLLKEHTDLDPELRKAIVSARQRAKKDIK